MQQTGTASEIAFGVGLAADTSSRHPSRLRRQQVVLKGAIVTAAGHPNIRPAQAVAQRGKHGRLVQGRSGTGPAKISRRHFGGRNADGSLLASSRAPLRSSALSSSIATSTGSCGLLDWNWKV